MEAVLRLPNAVHMSFATILLFKYFYNLPTSLLKLAVNGESKSVLKVPVMCLLKPVWIRKLTVMILLYLSMVDENNLFTVGVNHGQRFYF